MVKKHSMNVLHLLETVGASQPWTSQPGYNQFWARMEHAAMTFLRVSCNPAGSLNMQRAFTHHQTHCTNAHPCDRWTNFHEVFETFTRPRQAIIDDFSIYLGPLFSFTPQQTHRWWKSAYCTECMTRHQRGPEQKLASVRLQSDLLSNRQSFISCRDRLLLHGKYFVSQYILPLSGQF